MRQIADSTSATITQLGIARKPCRSGKPTRNALLFYALGPLSHTPVTQVAQPVKTLTSLTRTVHPTDAWDNDQSPNQPHTRTSSLTNY